MSVRQHLLATLAACFAITLAATFALHFSQERESAALALNFSRERQEQLDEAVQAESAALGLFVQDYSGWDEMVAFAASLDPEWARLNLAAVLERFRIDAVWLVSPGGVVLYHLAAPGSENFPPPPLTPIVASRQWNAEVGGFYRAGDAVIDLRARPVQPTVDTERTTPPVAWLLAARTLNADFSSLLSRKLQAEVQLRPPEGAEPASREGAVMVHHPLPAFFDPAAPIAEWHATFPIAALQLGEDYNRSELLVLLVSGLLLFGLVAWSLNRNVLHPLARISQSLAADSPVPLAGISPRLPEFARIADLVRQSFHQREALRREIEERVQLGRDLHDGVIQNLYATGMGLAHCQRLLTKDPAQALARLEETRGNLNQTMNSLRGFIARMEPEPTGPVQLADACVTLFQTVRGRLPCELDLHLSPDADTHISLAQKAALLFIIREAVARAVLRSGARQIHLSLVPDQSAPSSALGHWFLRIHDDGYAGAPDPDDHLGNIRTRATELGGLARFQSSPGGGTEIHVRW